MDRQRLILVVDDDASVLRSTSRLLIARGYSVVEASNAADALARAMDTLPDAILMDLHMAPISGQQAARELKMLGPLKLIPIIALSATPSSLDASSQLFARVLLKPCPSRDIVDAIESVLRQP